MKPNALLLGGMIACMGCDPVTPAGPGEPGGGTGDASTSTPATPQDPDRPERPDEDSSTSTSGEADSSTGDAPGSSATSEPGGTETGDGGESGSTGTDAVPGHLLWLLDLETGAVQAEDDPHDGVNTTLCTMFADEALAVIPVPDAPTGYGQWSLQTHIAENWPWGPDMGCNKKIRTRLSLSSIEMLEGEEYWTGFAVHLDEPWAPGGSATVANFHGPGGTPPQFRIIAQEGAWRLTSKPGLLEGATEFGATASGWHEFVVRAVFSKDESIGEFEAWYRGPSGEFEVVVQHEGKTAEDSAEFPFHPKLGIIAGNPPWDDAQSSRTLVFDEIRVGSSDSSFDEVAPGSSVGLP